MISAEFYLYVYDFNLFQPFCGGMQCTLVWYRNLASRKRIREKNKSEQKGIGREVLGVTAWIGKEEINQSGSRGIRLDARRLTNSGSPFLK